MKKTVQLFVALLTSSLGFSQTDTINQRIFFIGDAGELRGDKQPVVDYVAKHADMNDPKTTVIYLGDNVYPLGLPMEGEAGYEDMKKILDAQINLVKGKKARAFFVLGNHDWKNGKLGGWQQALNQQRYIRDLEQKNINIFPTEGCPGPLAVELSDKIVGVFIDSQWFLYVHEKPGPESACEARTPDEFATELREIAHSYPNHLMLLIMHHPMYTFGPHGGDYTFKEHLFPLTALNPKLWIPLPVLGSIYPITRGVFGSLQDYKHPLYQNMREIIENVMKEHPNAVHIAGHEHALQMIIKDSLPFIISGSGINLSRVKENRKGELMFSNVTENGFVMMEVWKSGKVDAKFYTLSSKDLSDPKYTQKLDSVIKLPEPKEVRKDSIPHWPDSITVIANTKLKAGSLKKLFMGKNYRQEWTTPIKVPVLDLGKEEGGLTPEKQGGGKQTVSLRVEDKNGKEWSLRSIQKFPEAAIPPDLRSAFAKEVVEDGVSAAYPFASLSVTPLAKAAHVPTLRRKLVYIPDDPRLGRFRSTFKNTLAVLEEREPQGIEKTYNTDELVVRLAKDNDDHVDQKRVLMARLLDNFYMDFDRHEGQWRWATQDTGKGKIYYPIPKDQDQAFFVNQGILPWLAKSPSYVPELQGFKASAHNIATFNKPARNFDRFFLNELDWPDWEKAIDTFLPLMTDAAIDEALARQPREIVGFHGPEIAATLKERRKNFKEEMKAFYEFISQRVNIVGTNQKELITITKSEGGATAVVIHKIDKEGAVSSKIYDRTFRPDITKELRIYALEDNDSIVVRGGATPIKIRIIGGPGKDDFINEGEGNSTVIVYDVLFEENTFSGNVDGLRKKLSRDPRNNMFNRIFFKYNIFNPDVRVTYNVDDGLFLGLAFTYTRHGFRNEPWASRQRLAFGRALRTNSVYFRYDAEINKAIGNSDVVIKADVRAPINVSNFFGLGNNTAFNTNLGAPYFRARYNVVNASVFLRRQLQSWMRVNAGPIFQYFKVPKDENAGKFLEKTSINGLDPATVYLPKSFVGAEVALDINSRNNQVLPTRGFVLDAGIRQYFGTNKNSSNLTQLHWDMSIIASFVPRARFVLATRLGWYHNIGHFEFPQANYLSGPDNLRGFRRNRFGGRSMWFNNTEVRMKLGNFNTYLFPGSYGLLAFHDIGRVYQDGEKSSTWHNGYGGGLWFSPVQKFVITGSIAHSKEEKILPYFTIGFQF